VTSLGYQAFDMAFDPEKNVSLTVPESVESVGLWCFAEAGLREIIWNTTASTAGNTQIFIGSYIKKAVLSDKITVLGDMMFANCKELKLVKLPSGLTDPGEGVFYGCLSLEEIQLPETLTEIPASMFSDCNALKRITIPDGVTSIGNSAFSECKLLENITIPDGVTSIGAEAFKGCKLLKLIVVPKNVREIGVYTFTTHSDGLVVKFLGDPPAVNCHEDQFIWGDVIMHYPAENKNWTLEKINALKNPHFELTRYKYYADGTLVRTGNCGESIEWELTDDGILTLYGTGSIDISQDSVLKSLTKSITAAVITEGITGIKDKGFAGFADIESVTLPKGLQEIGNQAFSGCKSVRTMVFLGDLPAMNQNALFSMKKMTVYTPKNNTTWENRTGDYGATSTQWKISHTTEEPHASGSVEHDEEYHWTTCTGCPERLNTAPHSYGEKWKHDEQTHWQECAGCGVKNGEANHEWNDGVIEGTTKTYTCKTCALTKTETVELPPQPTEPTVPTEPTEPSAPVEPGGSDGFGGETIILIAAAAAVVVIGGVVAIVLKKHKKTAG